MMSGFYKKLEKRIVQGFRLETKMNSVLMFCGENFSDRNFPVIHKQKEEEGSYCALKHTRNQLTEMLFRKFLWGIFEVFQTDLFCTGLSLAIIIRKL